MSEALRQALKVIDKHSISAIRTNSKDCGDWAEDMAYVGKVAREALAQPPAPTAQPASSDADRLLHEVFALCEDTEDKMAERDGQFERGRAFEAKGIRRAIGTWFQDTFCGRSFMGEAAQPVQQPSAEFDHSIGADRFTVRRGSFWWHVRIGGSTSNVGKFHTKLAAEDMALKMLTAYRDGAFEQYQAARAHAAPAQRQPLPPGLRLAAAFTRADLGPDGSNYPHVRELLAFAEQALGITAAPEAQKGEKL